MNSPILETTISQRTSTGRPSATSALWGHLLRKNGSQLLSTARPIASAVPVDKSGASTRILLHDTQARLEQFTERVVKFTTGVDEAKRELVGVQKLYQDDHEQLVERMIGLANRCQTELQKAIGSPAQSARVDELSTELSILGNRLEVLDKKMDALSVSHSQALQTIQDQQGQILVALLPLLPLLQSVPLHIENARNQIKDSVSGLSGHVSSLATVLVTSKSQQSVKRGRSHTLECTNIGTPPEPKKRRVDGNTRLRGPSSASPESMTRVELLPSGMPPRADIPSSDKSLPAFISPSSRNTAPRTPLADLVPSDELPTKPSVARSMVTSHSTILRPASSSRGLVSSYVASTSSTPRRALSTRHHLRASHASTPVPTGSQLWPHAVDHTLNTPRDRNGNLLHPALAARVPPFISTTPVVDRRECAGALWSSLGPRTSMRSPSSPPSSVGKPMKLKDRRALLPEDQTRNEGKRFIPLDDDDDEDLELELAG